MFKSSFYPKALKALTGSLILSIGSAVYLPTIAQTNATPSHPNTSLAQAPQPVNETPGLTPATNPNISFRRPLRVTNIRIPIDWQYRRTEYLFTVHFPADAVEPLAKLVF